MTIPYLGLDIGTSAVKAVLVDGAALLAEASAPVATSRPQPLWSEQDPDDWWRATETVMAALAAAAPEAFRRVGAIGLSGQMHGAVVLGADDRPLRPVIIWNDGRSAREAAELDRDHPGLADRMGVRSMPGFTAPKLKWLAGHEPALFARIRTVMLPKDYVRLQLTGERVSDPSDGAGAWLLDEARREWDAEALAAVGLTLAHMPRLVEGSAVSGRLRPAVAARWGLAGDVVVAGGGGDAAVGGVGIGAIDDGAAFLSIGTSAQLFVAMRLYRPAVASLVHAFCHALPARWYQMGAMLNGASALAWGADMLGAEVGALVGAVEAEFAGPSPVTFLPYLTGERTPHDNPDAKGVLFGMTPSTQRTDLAQSIMEGVAYSLADAKTALETSGTTVPALGLIGGGARSRLWTRIIAAVLDRPILRYRGADKGPAFGAALLARLAATGEDPAAVCLAPPIDEVIEPESRLVEAYRPRVAQFRRLYTALKPEFSATA